MLLTARRKYRSVTLGLLLLVLWAFQAARAERLPIKIYTTADGLPNNNINKIVRDSRGFLWFCTAEGLSLFDGHSFVNFGVDDGLPHANVNDILETTDGDYWVATQGGLCRFRPRKYSERQSELDSGRPASNRLFESIVLADDDSHARMFFVLLQSRDGTVWCGTGRGVFQVQKHESRVALIKIDIGLAPAQGSFVTSLLEDRYGTLWVGSAKGLHLRSPDGRVAHYGLEDGLPDENIHDLLEDRQGNIWIGTRFGGLLEVSPHPTKSPLSITRIYNSKTGLKADWVFDLYETSDGRLVVGTNKGLVEFSSDEKQRDAPSHVYTKSNGFSYHEIMNINEDRDGNLWLGSVNGAMKLAREGFVSFGEQDGIYTSNFLFESANAELYYFGYIIPRQKSFSNVAIDIDSPPNASYYAAIGRFDDQVDHGFSWVMPELGSAHVSWGDKAFILMARSGEWWIGTTDGVYVFPRVRNFSELRAARPLAVYRTRDGLAAPVVFTLYEDSHGNIWISTISPDGNGLSRWERSSKTLQNMAGTQGLPSLKHVLPVYFQEDRAGNMWIGLSQQGIARYKDGHFTLFGTNDGLPPGRVNDLFLDRQGRLWIATSRGGLSHVEETNAPLPAFINYRMAEGLSSNQLTAIAEDSYGRIYAATGRGVDQLTPETGRVKHYTTADGLAPGQILDVFGDRNGSLWFATNQGLSRFVPQPERHSPAPPIFIKALRLGGEKQAISPLGETDINLHDIVPARNQLQIDFVGISFLPGEKIAYQYKLEGTKDDWSMQAEQATINFASLAPGHYRLLMRAIDADGLISPAPASITFTVLRPFWQRWWFVLFATVTLVLMSYWIYRYRLSRLLELERVRTRIASDLHDDIGSGLSRLAILSEVSRHEASGAKVSERLGEIADGARQLVDSMSDIVWIVNPKLDQLRDLVQRMRRFASDLFTASGIEFTFQGPDEQHMKVEPDVRRHLFLIFKESVNNAARHSACTKADIRLLLEDGCFILTIADNGRGFDPANAAEGNGLINMRERARTLNGDFIIDSRSGAGTTISLKAPLKGTVKERNGRLRGSKP